MDFLYQPWPWYIAGPLIAFTMMLMHYFGKGFGVSTNFKTICTVLGAGKKCDFFEGSWKEQKWNLIFMLGVLIGGYIAGTLLKNPEPIQLSENVINDLVEMGISDPGTSYIPTSIFALENLFTIQGLIFIIGGGFLVGFGARYAAGCTSGHAISGLSNLQWPSLIAVIGFFIGGILSTYLLIPFLLNL
jgi:hypothetical protein